MNDSQKKEVSDYDEENQRSIQAEDFDYIVSNVTKIVKSNDDMAIEIINEDMNSNENID